MFKALVAGEQKRVVADEQRSLKAGHIVVVEVFPRACVDKEKSGLAVAYKVMHVVGLEVMQYRHYHSPVCKRSESHYGPLRRIAAT